MKKCPFCAEDIQSQAKKCKHCGEFLAEAIKNANNAGSRDFSRCKIIKEGPTNILCPKCGFQGVTKEIKGDYNATIFWVLLFVFPIIGGLLYYHFSTKNQYVCPQCDNDYLEVI